MHLILAGNGCRAFAILATVAEFITGPAKHSRAVFFWRFQAAVFARSRCKVMAAFDAMSDWVAEVVAVSFELV